MSSDKNDAAPKVKKKGGGVMMKAIAALVLVGAGGGVTFALVEAGMLGGTHAEEKPDNTPKLVRKGEEDPFAPPPAKGEEEGAADIPGDGGSKYRTAYYTFTDDFTSNLSGSAGLIQVSIAASTHRDGRVLMWLKKHELAARSAILIVLADTPEEELLRPDGKDRLAKRIAAAINKVLVDAEGFGGIDAVYFRNLLVQ